VFSLVFRNATNGIAVGGDYTKEKEVGETLPLRKMEVKPGKAWLASIRKAIAPAVTLIHGLGIYIAVGPSGTDSSNYRR